MNKENKKYREEKQTSLRIEADGVYEVAAVATQKVANSTISRINFAN